MLAGEVWVCDAEGLQHGPDGVSSDAEDAGLLAPTKGGRTAEGLRTEG